MKNTTSANIELHHLTPHSCILHCSVSWCRRCAELKFDHSFVELKINNQTLDSDFAPVSPGEVFKVDHPEDELVKRVMLLPLP